jgi:NitT/TauT family transport system ATP-binding protein
MERSNINTDIFMKKEQPTVEVVPTVEVQPQIVDLQPTTENKKEYNRGNGSIDVIKIEHLTQIFNEGEPNEYRLFEDFNLTIPDFVGRGQLISIMGGSGCGKSQLLRAIAGLSKIPNGDIKIYGKDINECDRIPMVFQTYSNYEWMTVLENVMLPMTIRGIDRETAKKKAMELIDIVGLTEHMDKYAKNSSLSGGQLQRVSIARSLACNSPIILLDEATGALDIKMKREVQNVILKIFYESELDPTIINVTHSIEEAVYLSNRVIVLQPKPCRIFKTIDINYDGESERQRGNWVFNTRQFDDYTNELTQCLEEVCK